MTMNKDPFNSPREEADRLASELRDVKEVLKEIASRMSRIETRVKRAFPDSVKRAKTASGDNGKNVNSHGMSASEALSLYDGLVNEARNGSMDEVRFRLDSMAMQDLMNLRQQIGVSLQSRKPSRMALTKGIMSRISESVMLSQHVSRQDIVNGERQGEAVQDETSEK